MTDETRDQIALFRYKLISPVLAEPGREQNAYFRKQAERDHNVPHYGVRRFQLSTMKGWLKKYRRKGLKGLRPKPRADLGRPRRLDDNAMQALRVRCKAFPHYTVTMLYLGLQADGALAPLMAAFPSHLRSIPPGLASSDAAWVEPAATALRAVERTRARAVSFRV